MKLKWILFTVILGLGFSTNLFAEGYLTVITGKPEAKIFIDGQYVGNKNITRTPLESGEHYVRVEYKGKLMYAKMVYIEEGSLKAITSENFVDIRTTAPSRGAIDREAQRLRETKGDFGMGFVYAEHLPALGVSLKWNALGNFGLQVSGISGISKENAKFSYAGVRLIYNIGDKIFGDTLFNGYIAPGIAFVEKKHNSNAALSYNAANIGINIGAEMSFFDPVYFSFEVGTVYQKRSNAPQGDLLFSYAAGVHVYF